MHCFECGNSFVGCIKKCTKESGKEKHILVVVTSIERNKSVVAGNFFLYFCVEFSSVCYLLSWNLIL